MVESEMRTRSSGSIRVSPAALSLRNPLTFLYALPISDRGICEDVFGIPCPFCPPTFGCGSKPGKPLVNLKMGGCSAPKWLDVDSMTHGHSAWAGFVGLRTSGVSGRRGLGATRAQKQRPGGTWGFFLFFTRSVWSKIYHIYPNKPGIHGFFEAR